MADFSWLGDYAEQFLKSPSWTAPITEFIDEHCLCFGEDEEHRLDETEAHAKFCALIDDLLCAHLLQVDVSPDDFARYTATELPGNSAAKKMLVDDLASISDFLVFKRMMVARNKSLDAEATKEAEKVAAVEKENEAANAAPAAAAKPQKEMLDAVLRKRQAERDLQLKKWLEDPEPPKKTAVPTIQKMSAAQMREAMKAGTEHRAPGKSFVKSLQGALA